MHIEVTYWDKWTGFELDAMRGVVEDFNQSQDRIRVKLLPVGRIYEKTMLATAGGNPPDIAGLGSAVVPSFAERGALMPLDRRLREAGIHQDDYLPVLWDACSHRGMVWALPSTPATLALHWNKQLFKEAGLDPDRPPGTLDELHSDALKLTRVRIARNGQTMELTYPELTEREKTDRRFELVRVGYLPNVPGWYDAMWPVWFDGQWWDGRDKATANSPANIAAFMWYASYAEQLGRENVARFASGLGSFASAQNGFLSGRVAMVQQGVWMYNFIEKLAPGLQWGAAPFPGVDGVLPTDKSYTLVESDVWVIPRGARHPDEAFEFLKYASSPQALEKLCMGQRKFPPLVKVSEQFVASHPNPYIKVFIDLAHSPRARTWPKLGIWTEYQNEIKVAASRILSGAGTPEEALGEVQRRMQRKLDRQTQRWKLIGDDRLREWESEM